MAAFPGTAVATTAEYLGLLFHQGKQPLTFLRLAGGVQMAADGGEGVSSGVKDTTSLEFPIGVFYSLPAPSQPGRFEGAAPPAATNTTLTQATNVIQIFQESVSETYLAMSENSVSGTVPLPQGEVNRPVQNPRSLDFQSMAVLEKIKQDMNYSFLRGVYNKPADPSQTSALATRGALTAIATNIVDQSGTGAGTINAAALRGYITALLQSMIAYNGYLIDETFVLMADAITFGNVANAYATQGTIYLQPEEKIFGVKVRKFQTTFGTMLLALDPMMPPNTIAVFDFNVIGVVGQKVPKKGYLFQEDLYKQGSSEQEQIYGQFGIDHGPEYMHGKILLPAGVAVAG